MASSHSDALVLFGVTGDLAHKMIFPALYAMVKRGTLRAPIIRGRLPEVEPRSSAQARDGQHRAIGRNR
jgi:glucose-6-phosphate 1-dehydrogenase